MRWIIIFTIVVIGCMHLYTYLDRMLFLSKLEGTIYYLKENKQNGLIELYKSDASLTNETLMKEKKIQIII